MSKKCGMVPSVRRASSSKLASEPFIGIAFRLALLDDLDELVETGIILADLNAAPLQRVEEV